MPSRKINKKASKHTKKIIEDFTKTYKSRIMDYPEILILMGYSMIVFYNHCRVMRGDTLPEILEDFNIDIDDVRKHIEILYYRENKGEYVG